LQPTDFDRIIGIPPKFIGFNGKKVAQIALGSRVVAYFIYVDGPVRVERNVFKFVGEFTVAVVALHDIV
jgi:hypothetical protein